MDHLCALSLKVKSAIFMNLEMWLWIGPSQKCAYEYNSRHYSQHTHSQMPFNIHKRVLKLTFKRNIPSFAHRQSHRAKKCSNERRKKKSSPSNATTNMEYVLICEFISLFFFAVCLVPYVRREVSTFAWVYLCHRRPCIRRTHFIATIFSKCWKKTPFMPAY